MRFITAFTFTVAIMASVLYGLILAVDPYNKFGYNLFGFETKAVDFARENKFNQVEYAKKPYDAFIFGSSSAHRYQTRELNRLTGLTSYNYSTQSATPEDYIAMTRHILKKGFPVKMILISMDFEALSTKTKTDDMFYSSPLKDYLTEVPKEELENDLFNNSYLTLEAINDSVKVIWVNLFSKAQHAYLEDGDHELEKRAKTLKVKQFNGGEFELDQKRMGYLRTIKELADQNGFKVIVFTSPVSKEYLDRMYAIPGIKEKHAEFKAALASIFGEVHDFENYGNNPFNTTEYFMDANHPTHKFSTIVLERIFGKPMAGNPEFGQVLK